jgi:hypothetical protein
MAKTAAAVRQTRSLVKKSDMSSVLGQLAAHPMLTGTLAGGLGGGLVGGLTSGEDEYGHKQRGRGILSGAMAGAGLGGGLGLAYSAGKDLLPKLNMKPTGGLPPHVREKLPGVVNQISELEQQSPVAAPIHGISSMVGDYASNHPYMASILGAIGLGDIGSHAAGAGAGIARNRDPKPTARLSDLMGGIKKWKDEFGEFPKETETLSRMKTPDRDIGSKHIDDVRGIRDSTWDKLTHQKATKIKNPSLVDQDFSDWVQDYGRNREEIQKALLQVRSGITPERLVRGKAVPLRQDQTQFMGRLTEMGRGRMGGATELTDTLNALGGLMGIKKKIPALFGTGFRRAANNAIQDAPGIHNSLLRTLSTHDFKMPGVGGVLPRLALYAGLPLANWGAGEWMADREKQRKIKEIVNQLGGK